MDISTIISNSWPIVILLVLFIFFRYKGTQGINKSDQNPLRFTMKNIVLQLFILTMVSINFIGRFGEAKTSYVDWIMFYCLVVAGLIALVLFVLTIWKKLHANSGG